MDERRVIPYQADHVAQYCGPSNAEFKSESRNVHLKVRGEGGMKVALRESHIRVSYCDVPISNYCPASSPQMSTNQFATATLQSTLIKFIPNRTASFY